MDVVGYLINAARAEEGDAPLRMSTQLNRLAEQRAQEYAQGFSGSRPDGSDWSSILEGVVDWNSVRETLLSGADTAEEAIDMLGSDVLGSNYDYLGVGIYDTGGRRYWALLYVGSSSNLSDAYIPSIPKGDLNTDGTIDVADATIALSYYAQISIGAAIDSSAALSSADIDGDGSITVEDARYILVYYAQTAIGDVPSWEEILSS